MIIITIISTFKFFKKYKNIKKKYIFIIFLIIIILFILITTIKILINLHNPQNLFPYHNTYNCQSNMVTIHSYSTKGYLKCIITTCYVTHILHDKITWFTNPKITIFDKKNIPIWRITANKAALNYNKILFLHGCVDIRNLVQHTSLQSIISNQAIINLTTQSVIMNTKVTVYGTNFFSISTKMHANLYTQTAIFIDDVKTYYDIQYIP
ncbi:LPS export ABC transporter periplasmic protein LptC [Candidatus Blochmannia ocreatus (nom. nud.)]|uniref:Lipopolysaccharide export system protein LptC n=1 Tax=Candidatus Blochmannia ocreatus (nom. nud.) TaxID=251538 RepID=A0ABY4SW12_9ENTR|nr:LPS export ABC transporter periplasmic protein LptC [Candidatus Blochmannia ocreatus]URJ25135.1 LPS export ABC transporter periplasmic protein LptC [Candidatus Blochmannia ocreatus]